MRTLILLLPLLLVGCNTMSKIAEGGKRLGHAMIDPNGYNEKRIQEYKVKECPKSFHQFKEAYFSEAGAAFEDIYKTLENSSYDSFINRLKTEGSSKMILKSNVQKSNPVLLALLFNDVSTYADTMKTFVEAIQKRGNYQEMRVGEKKPDYGLTGWPKDSDICDSFVEQEEYKELVKNYKLVDALADNIYDYAYGLEKKEFYRKAGFYIDGDNLLVPYMSGVAEDPVQHYLYYLNGLEVFQTIPGGVLARLRNGYSDKLIFVSTSRQFVDSVPLDNIPVLLTGTKTYSTVLKVNKTIYAFKIVDTSPYRKIVQNFYFYPTVKDTLTIDEKTLEKNMQQLFTVVK